MPFLGTIEQDNEGKLIGYDYTFPRRILRVLPECLVKTMDTIRDDMGRYWLLADHDGAFAYNIVDYRSHMLIPMVKNVRWERETTKVDPLTKLTVSTGKALIDNIWVLPERVSREVADSVTRLKEDGYTIFTSAALQLNDIVDNMVVKRISVIRGVNFAEVQ